MLYRLTPLIDSDGMIRMEGRKEYVPGVNSRSKWLKESKPLKKRDIVFIVDGKIRKEWIRGVIEEAKLSKDERCRQALVRTASGVFKRGACNLAVVDVK